MLLRICLCAAAPAAIPGQKRIRPLPGTARSSAARALMPDLSVTA